MSSNMKLEPNNRDTKALAGLVARYDRDYPTAIKVFEELVRDHPSFGFATGNLTEPTTSPPACLKAWLKAPSASIPGP